MFGEIMVHWMPISIIFLSSCGHAPLEVDESDGIIVKTSLLEEHCEKYFWLKSSLFSGAFYDRYAENT